MSSISVEIRYSEKCPKEAFQIENVLFDKSFSFDGDSYTCERHLNHYIGFNYDCYLVAKNAYSRIRDHLRSVLQKNKFVQSYDIHLSPENKIFTEGI